MSAQANKALACQWVDAVNRRDAQVLKVILSTDFLYMGMGLTPKEMSVRWDKDRMLEIVMHLGVDRMKKPVVMRVVSEMCDGDWVCLEMEGDSETLDGRLYANAYCFLFEIDGATIKTIRDYCCTETALRQRGVLPMNG
jgi:ketosteroid isomerase-like protein